MIYLNNIVIDKIDEFFTMLFQRLQSLITFQTLIVLFCGMFLGIVIFSSILSIIYIKSLDKYSNTVTPKEDVDQNEVIEVINEIKNSYSISIDGLNTKESFEILKIKVKEEIIKIAALYYPESNYPLYELTIDEAIIFMHYLIEKIDELFDSNFILSYAKKTNIKYAFEIFDKIKLIKDNKVVQTVNKVKPNKLISIINRIKNIANPLYWTSKLTKSGTKAILINKLANKIFDIVGIEANKAYSKSFYNAQKDKMKLQLENIIEESEEEVNA